MLLSTYLHTANRHNYTIPQTQSRASSNIRPPLHTNPTLERLPQETLSGLKCLLIQLKVVILEDGRHNQCQFHFCNVAANTGTRTVAEGYEG